MHSNANIVFELQETRRLVDTVLSIQPRLAAIQVPPSPHLQGETQYIWPLHLSDKHSIPIIVGLLYLGRRIRDS